MMPLEDSRMESAFTSRWIIPGRCVCGKTGSYRRRKDFSMWVQFQRRKLTLCGFCKYGPPATCIILMARRRGILDIDGRPSAISMTVAPRDQLSMAVVYGFPFITSGAIHNGVPTELRHHVRSGVSFARKDTLKRP